MTESKQQCPSEGEVKGGLEALTDKEFSPYLALVSGGEHRAIFWLMLPEGGEFSRTDLAHQFEYYTGDQEHYQPSFETLFKYGHALVDMGLAEALEDRRIRAVRKLNTPETRRVDALAGAVLYISSQTDISTREFMGTYTVNNIHMHWLETLKKLADEYRDGITAVELSIEGQASEANTAKGILEALTSAGVVEKKLIPPRLYILPDGVAVPPQNGDVLDLVSRALNSIQEDPDAIGVIDLGSLLNDVLPHVSGAELLTDRNMTQQKRIVRWCLETFAKEGFIDKRKNIRDRDERITQQVTRYYILSANYRPTVQAALSLLEGIQKGDEEVIEFCIKKANEFIESQDSLSGMLAKVGPIIMKPRARLGKVSTDEALNDS